MKEGDLMDEFKELDVLENTDDTIKERLAEEFPPQDTDEKERVFRMSERKYNIKKNDSAEFFSGEETVKGVEVYKRPKWKIFASIAACAVIVAGIGGGGYMLKHLRGGVPETVMSEIKDKSTAPFGDFAASDYYIPDYNSEKKTFHLNDKFDVDIPYYSGEVIAYEKRQKIAEFFNSQEWKEAEPNEANEGGRKIEMTPEEIAENYITFQCVADGEIRNIEISSENTLTYNYYETREENGESVCDKYYCQEYEIDWELFNSTIDSILNDIAEETAEENVAPFGDFSELEYYIPYNDKEKAEEIITNNDTSFYGWFTLMTGTSIEQDKRDRLADFFNSYAWETYTNPEPDAEPVEKSVEESAAFDPYEENIVFLYRGDTEVREIQISKDGVLSYKHFNFVSIDGKLYKDPMGADIPYELYKVDYELFKSTIDNILSEEEVQTAPEDNNYVTIINTLEKYDDFCYHNNQKDAPSSGDHVYRLKAGDSDSEMYWFGNVLPNEKREQLLNIIKNNDWTSEPIPTDSLSEYEKKGAEKDEHFTEEYILREKTGNDFITFSIYTNRIQMTVTECDYDEATDLYYINSQLSTDIHTESPTFMTDVYNVLFGDTE